MTQYMLDLIIVSLYLFDYEASCSLVILSVLFLKYNSVNIYFNTRNTANLILIDVSFKIDPLTPQVNPSS